MTIDKNTCVNCGSCIESCPVEAISLINDNIVFDNEKCIHCGACMNNCPVGSIKED